MISTWLDLTPLAPVHRLQETEGEKMMGAGYPVANAAPPPASVAGWHSRTHVMLDTHLPLGRVPLGCSRCALYVPASAVSASYKREAARSLVAEDELGPFAGGDEQRLEAGYVTRAQV